MTAREELHLAVESMSDDQIVNVLEYIADLQTGLSDETLDAIREGLEDIRQGKISTVEEYRRARKL